MLTGLARDGGLYVPATWPRFTPTEIAGLAGKSYEDAAFVVMQPFIDGDIPDTELHALICDAYAGFSHGLVAPLVQIGPSLWVLELFRGPTLAFKDIAMQVLARLMDRTLARRGTHATIIAATSGDTGGAAVEAFRGRQAIDTFVLFPHGRVSAVQRRQMTTAADENVHPLAVDGTFDDCQAIVKTLFSDHVLRDEVGLAGVNSINWARLMAQIVYYFTSAVALGSPDRRITYSVPTGNFGDVFAGWAARRMGLPIDRLVIATNVNDILVRTLDTGRYRPAGVVATSSPSMDIQISSNFERFLFEASGRDPARVRGQMAALAQGTGFELASDQLENLRGSFAATRIDEAQTLAEIERVHAEIGWIADPHTAVGIAAARGLASANAQVPVVVLGTAHAAKFPDAVTKAIGFPPPVPPVVARQALLPERQTRLPNDPLAVADYIRAHTRAGRAA